jgi:hypothetical protein
MKDCSICFGIGWVCENHPDKAWHEELGVAFAARQCCVDVIRAKNLM